MIRHIESPGIEIQEIDNSYYNNKIDYSLKNSPTIFMFGFADKGEDYSINWINEKHSLDMIYGKSTNELERYFYSGISEILKSGGKVLTSKLPYYNASKDKFSYVDYDINKDLITNPDDEVLNALSSVDKSIDSILEITTNINSGKLTLEEFDNLKTNTLKLKNNRNKIRIVNIKRNKYDKVNFNCVKSKIKTEDEDETGKIELKYSDIDTNEILGYIPVVVSPVQAMFYQNILNIDRMDITDEEKNKLKEKFITLTTFKPINVNPGDGVDKNRHKNFYNDGSINVVENLKELLDNNVSIDFYKNKIDSEIDIHSYTLSKIVTDLFPIINYKNENSFDNRFFKSIGIVVLKAHLNNEDGTIAFSVKESFVGSLDKNAKDSITHSSLFIDNIVNNNSLYINTFTNVDKKLIDNCDIVYMKPQVATSLGFYYLDTLKNLDYEESIIKPMNMCFNKMDNSNNINIDIVLDAGISNIGQFIFNNYKNEGVTLFGVSDMDITNRELLPLDTIDVPMDSSESIKMWKSLIYKFDDFCRNIRKDCIFVADSPKGFCLTNDSKIVRNTSPSNSISNSILPKLRFLSDINSNYSVGYCNWFKTYDENTDSYFWAPPSIQAAHVMIYTDVYFHTWDAPAGLTRGMVADNVYDIAFNPNTAESGKIYNYAWNYAVSYPLNGIIIEGQKTFQINKTALDRVNVRRLMLWLEKSVKNVAKFFVYEKNTPYVRQLFVDSIVPIMESAKTGGGVYEYVVKCDDVLNTNHVIENNELRCQIMVKPVKTIEFIVLSFTITNQSANLTESVQTN